MYLVLVDGNRSFAPLCAFGNWLLGSSRLAPAKVTKEGSIRIRVHLARTLLLPPKNWQTLTKCTIASAWVPALDADSVPSLAGAAGVFPQAASQCRLISKKFE